MNALVRSETVVGNERAWGLAGDSGCVSWSVWSDGTSGPVQIHSVRPMWRDHRREEECEFVTGGCYLDMHHGQGVAIGEGWEAAEHDDEMIWSELNGWYNFRLLDDSRTPVDVSAALGGPKPMKLFDSECRFVLQDVINGVTVQAAIRRRYRARRHNLLRLARDLAPKRFHYLHSVARHLPNPDRMDAFMRLREAAESEDQPSIETALDNLAGVRG